MSPVSTESGTGSPPRVRGIGHFGVCDVFDFGITPACAGNSGFVFIVKMTHKDHPRVCGE